MTSKFGWKKDKYNKKAWIHKMKVARFPDRHYIEVLPSVRDQGSVGSCVGFGIGGPLTGYKISQVSQDEWFSPTWIYNGARFIEGTLPYDDGCYPEDAMEWIRMKGCLLEHFWPYNPDRLDPTSPPSSFEPEAKKYPIIEYFRVTNEVEGICDALSSGYYVSIGTPWFDKWLDVGSDGLLPEVSTGDSVAGGHETYLYGYDYLKKLFAGVNSWGKAYADGGKFLMPMSSFNTFKLIGGYDAHYVRVNWATVPPVPDPEPIPDDGKCSLAKAYFKFGWTHSATFRGLVKKNA